MKSRIPVLVALAVGVLLGETAASGQPSRAAPPGAARQILQDFDARLKRIDGLLVEGGAKKAYTQCESLLRDMGDALIGGPGVGQLLGVATLLRALAAYQLDRRDEALWHWHVATQMYPAVADYQMTAYGDATDFLRSRPLGTLMDTRPAPKDGPFQPPKKRRSPMPTIPRARRGSERVSVIVSTIIDEKGRPQEPRIMQSEGELTLVYAVLDTLRFWEFEPARKGGAPVRVPFVLKVNFSP